MSFNKKPNNHGGYRPGAGRPAGSGPHGEPTRIMRIPQSQAAHVKSFINAQRHRDAAAEMQVSHISIVADLLPRQEFPLVGARVAAGFPSPADDYIETRIDLNEYLIVNKDATFIVEARGLSMLSEGIHDRDKLVVDRSIDPMHGQIVIAVVNGSLTVKKLFKQGGIVRLLSGNTDYPAIEFQEEDELIIWGIVTYVLHKL